MFYKKLAGKQKYKYMLTQNIDFFVDDFPLIEIKNYILISKRFSTLIDDTGKTLDKIKITIKKGYCWDGGSGPAIDNKPMIKASLLHDALYQIIREGKVSKIWRKKADQLFRKELIENGTCKIRAYWCYLAVRLFGWIAI